VIHRTLNQLTVLAAAVGIFAGCRNESRFSTGNGHYEGQVVSGTFVRANVVDGLDRRRSHLAVEHRELPEDLSRTEVRERDRPTVGVLTHDAGHA